MPALILTDEAPEAAVVDALVVGVAPSKSGLTVVADHLPSGALAWIADDLRKVGCDAASGGSWRIPGQDGLAAQSVIVVACPADPSDLDLRRAAGTAARTATSAQALGYCLPTASDAALAAVCEGALLGGLPPLTYKAGAPKGLTTIRVHTKRPRVARDEVARRVRAEVAACAATRDLVNEPPGFLTPQVLAERAQEAVADLPITCEVWDETRLAAEHMGGLVGVGQGSVHPPRLVALAFRPADARAHLALVGKGITFDSGGLSIKAAKPMMDMKKDMAGAAAVLAAIVGIAELGLPLRVSAYLACAENMPSGTAQRPGDVLHMRNGKTVEVLNTDAEGRLVMADVLTLAAEQEPDHLVDIATLTGAQMIALGSNVAAAMGSPDLVNMVVEAGASVGEAFWPMPLPEQLRPSLTSQVADIKNIGEQMGGMLVAGLFLKEFVPQDQGWTHLDIAGPAYNDSTPHGFTPKGGTGFGARSLIALARSLCAD